MKKTLKFLIAIFIATASVSATTYAFSDVSENDFYYDSVTYLEDQGFIVGYSDGTFGYDLSINRAELLKLVIESKYFNQNKDFLNAYSKATCFDDVPAGQWYTSYICFAAKHGYVVGYSDGTFRPAQNINFVEALKIVMEVFESDYSQTSPWYKGLTDSASGDNLIPLTIDSFSKVLSRAEVVDLLARKIKFDQGALDIFLDDRAGINVSYETISDGDELWRLIDGSEMEDELADYYKENFEVFSFEYIYNADGGTNISFSLLNGGDKDIEDGELKIVFQNNLLQDLFTFDITKIYLDSSGVKYFSQLELDEINSKLAAAKSANFYFNDVFFDTANISIIDTTLANVSILDTDAHSNSIDFRLEAVTLASNEEYFVECYLDDYLRATSSSKSSNLTVSGLSSLKEYDCRAGISVDGSVQKFSNYVSIKTGFDAVVFDDVNADFNSVSFILADEISLADNESYYAKCIESGVIEKAADEELYHKTVVDSEVNTITVDGLKDNTSYNCYVAIQTADGSITDKSEIVEVKTDLNADQINLAAAYGEVDQGVYIILSISNGSLAAGEKYHAECQYSGGMLSSESDSYVIVFDSVARQSLYQCSVYITGKNSSTMSETVFVQTP